MNTDEMMMDETVSDAETADGELRTLELRLSRHNFRYMTMLAGFMGLSRQELFVMLLRRAVSDPAFAEGHLEDMPSLIREGDFLPWVYEVWGEESHPDGE